MIDKILSRFKLLLPRVLHLIYRKKAAMAPTPAKRPATLTELAAPSKGL